MTTRREQEFAWLVARQDAAIALKVDELLAADREAHALDQAAAMARLDFALGNLLESRRKDYYAEVELAAIEAGRPLPYPTRAAEASEAGIQHPFADGQAKLF